MVPLVAILPILLYIGLVIGAQAFQATPARHAPAVMLAHACPNIAAWAQSQMDGALAAAGTSAAAGRHGQAGGQWRDLSRACSCSAAARCWPA